MKITIPYGKDGKQHVEIPDKNFAGVLYPNDVVIGEERKIIEEAIENPLQSSSLTDFLRGAKNIVFIVNDATRPTPTHKVLDILDELMDLESARYLIATGSHRAPTEEEYRFIFGKHLEKLRTKIHAHDSKKDEMVCLGRSKNGTEMWVNKIAVDADRLIVITSVEPHYFAGYTGGRKSFFPGVASYETIEQNHKLAMRPDAQILVLSGNPVHEDMMDALSTIDRNRIFSIQLVLDRHQRVYRAAAGDINAAFEKAVEWANEVFVVPIKMKADIIVSVAPFPMDVDLYQSQKALDNAKWALKEGGIIILVSQCRHGIGHDTFYKQLSFSSDPQKILENLSREYKLGYHKTAKIAEILLKSKIFAITDLDPDMLRKANITPFNSIQSAVNAALQEKKDAKILILMDGSVTVPRVDSND
ncbi:MAG: nickel-dependent lactate racemase [Methanomassiliicoccales archaeon]|nr:nickel-dependent lactate racemase [Methanomassiliicoccales archaeon]